MENTAETQPPKRRRAERPSDADDIDRSWDSADVTNAFLEASDPQDARFADDTEVILDESPVLDPQMSDELDPEFWEEQKPPHYSE